MDLRIRNEHGELPFPIDPEMIAIFTICENGISGLSDIHVSNTLTKDSPVKKRPEPPQMHVDPPESGKPCRVRY
jgi:hypothetical protein